ncbi:MAG: hypothetical protein EXR81_03710 [Gammaproteobacteria bacterium]|nr:hypothetical protein [Gammaproteobacteria bacterium]
MYRIAFVLFIFFGFMATTFADDLKILRWKPIVSVSVGVASTHIAANQTILSGDTPPVQNVYTPNHTTMTQAMLSLFLGAEHATNGRFDMQFGVGYYFNPSTKVNGSFQQSIEAPSNLYNYQYAINTQQLLAEGKLLFKWRKQILPYVSVGLGTAFNHVGNYSATPQSDTAGPPPLFNAHDQTNFSYSVGFGLDMILKPQIRLGVGYRYSNLGAIALAEQNNSGTLKNKNYYNHAVLASLSYLF